MSYLDALRFHFFGDFFSDPSTINNHEAHYTASTWRSSTIPCQMLTD